MTVLMVHNYYHTRVPSGENASFEAEAELLRARGHRVITYTRSNDEIFQYRLHQKATASFGTVWSFRTSRELRRTIIENRPDIAHFQNTFPLISPSALWTCRDASVPIVQSLRNFRLLCPDASLFHGGRVCESCSASLCSLPGVLRGCYHNSRIHTGIIAASRAFHRISRTWDKAVDIFIANSRFARDKYIAAGIPGDKILIKPNFVDPDPGMSRAAGEYAFFAGRLSAEKGVDTLMHAWRELPGIPLKIAGAGPLEGELVGTLKAPGFRNVEFLGKRPVADVLAMVAGARLVLIPSKLYETFGRIAVEAFACGTPVLASRLGALADVVQHGRTGLHFDPGDAAGLAGCVRSLWENPHLLAEMRHHARQEYLAKYTAEANYQRLIHIYETARFRGAGFHPARRFSIGRSPQTNPVPYP